MERLQAKKCIGVIEYRSDLPSLGLVTDQVASKAKEKIKIKTYEKVMGGEMRG